MRELLDDLMRWWEADQPVAAATVVGISASAPRGVGATMLVGPSSEAVGSISGGCVEGTVYDACLEAQSTGQVALQRFSPDDDGFAVALTCGGDLEVFTRRIDRQAFPDLPVLAESVRTGRPVALVTVIAHQQDDLVGQHVVVSESDEVGAPALAGVRAVAHQMLEESGGEAVVSTPEYRCLVEVFLPAPRMLIFGAVDFAASLTRVGSMLGYAVTVCDARPVFATEARFPEAAEVVNSWPHRYLAAEVEAGRLDRRTVICVLTHDPKFDVPLLEIALRLDEPAYVGAMGSRRTDRERRERLSEIGVTAAEMARLASPIGLDLRAQTPDETAISIVAEIIAARRGGSGQPLAQSTGPIRAVAQSLVEPAPPLVEPAPPLVEPAER